MDDPGYSESGCGAASVVDEHSDSAAEKHDESCAAVVVGPSGHPIGNVLQNQETAAVAGGAPTVATRKDSDQKSAAGLVHSVLTLRAGSLRRRRRADRAIDRVGAVERLLQVAGDPAAVGRLHLVGLVDAASLIPEEAQTFRSAIDEQ